MFSRVSVATPIFIITFDSFQLNCDLVVVNVLACFKARNQIDGPMRNGYWKEKIEVKYPNRKSLPGFPSEKTACTVSV